MQSRQQVVSQPSGKGRAFGTFGELLQGVGVDGQDFLVTLPITRFSTATFVSVPSLPCLTVSPSKKQKSRRLARLMLQHYGLPMGGILELESDIPLGKGMASSSADLVATARAIDNCFGVCTSPEQLQSFMRQIEPTDGVMYEGCVSFYHREVALSEYLGHLPDLTIVSIDEGGEVDTIEFNKSTKHFTQEEKQEYDLLRQKIAHAIRSQDIQMIGQIATRSAILNQKHSKKHYLEYMLAICQDLEGLGVVVAHSGTCLGILLSPQYEHYYKQLYMAYETLRQLTDDISLFHSWHPNAQIQADLQILHVGSLQSKRIQSTKTSLLGQ